MIDSREWVVVAAGQAGVISRRQASELGLTPDAIRAYLRSGHWARVDRGVYVTFTGPRPALTRLWIALLGAGDGAAAGPRASLWLAGVLDEAPDPVDVVIPERRRVRRDSGVVQRRSGLDRARQPSAGIPRLRVDEAVIDVAAQFVRPEPVIDLVLRAVQRRRTSPRRLAECLAGRRAHRWRDLLTELLVEAAQGVNSPLERRWVSDVERPHGLPEGSLNHREVTRGGVRYRDVEYEPGLVCELDGREAHPDDARFRDRGRDNLVAASGRTTLRYGWREVVGDPCGVAAEVGDVLRQRGWAGRPQVCGPRCRLPLP
jgi:hypothetical protein